MSLLAMDWYVCRGIHTTSVRRSESLATVNEDEVS